MVLEEREHALRRGADIIAEIVGFGTNTDGRHVTQPNHETMALAMKYALDDAALDASAIGYVNAHGTATDLGDVAEATASAAVYGTGTPISTVKSYTGHTLGACGAIEAVMTVEMMRSGWFAPNLNLTDPDPECRGLDFIVGDGRSFDAEFAASNNFAFGGVNTSLIFKRV
jgi:3-oxoacyl-[acyl-carrier-protein] synthase II